MCANTGHFLRFCLLFTIAGCALSAHAQTYYLEQEAYPTFTAQFPVELGFINLANGNLHLEIPIASFPQRGKESFVGKIVYDSRFWSVQLDANGRPYWTPYIGNSGSGGWRFVTTGNPGTNGFTTQWRYCDGLHHKTRTTYSGFYWRDADNTLHNFDKSLTLVQDQCVPANNVSAGSGYATDMSGYLIQVSNYFTMVVLAKDGTQVYPTVQDRNGNFYSSDGNGNWIDTMGRTPFLVSNVNGNIDYLNTQGGRSRATETLTTVSVATHFGANGGDYSGLLWLPQSLALPDGSSYSFAYDSYGELTSITFPTGGQVSYSYTNFTDDRGNINRWVTSRTASGGTWSLIPQTGTCSGTSCQQQVTVTSPLNDDTVYSFTMFYVDTGMWNTQTQYYQGSSVSGGTLLLTHTMDYISSPYCCLTSGNTAIWPVSGGTLTRKVEYSYDGFTAANLTAAKEWDYYSNSSFPANPDRETDYAYITDSTYTSINMNMLSTTTTRDSAGTQRALTTYGYDQSGVTPTNAPQHNGVTGPRGNRTSIGRWLNTTGSTLTTTLTYDDAGNMLSSTDPGVHTTSYAYSTAFASAYPTQITRPDTSSPNLAHHVTSKNYDFNSGRVITETGENGLNTAYSYDSMLRPLTTTFPDGGQTSITYNDVPPFTVTTSTEVTSSVNITSVVTADGLGRTGQTQLTSDPDGATTVVTTYDVLGRKSTESTPYRTTSDSTYGSRTYNYDALNRPTTVIESDGSVLQIQYCANSTLLTDEAGHWRRRKADGFGRIIEVDEPNSLTATVSACPAQSDPIWATMYSYNTLDKLTSVLQAGSRQRIYTYDSLSRLVSSTNPESSTATNPPATVPTTYAYDPDGNLSSKTTPAPNQNGTATVMLSYCYDPLNRMTSKAYTAQSCPMPSPVATYSYDQNACLGQSSCYNVGRRTAMTDAAGSESWAYDKMGRVWANQRTTNSILKTTLYSYNLDGSLATLTYPSTRVITYQPGGAGRPLSAVDTPNSINYATGAHYAPPGGLGQIQNGTNLTSTFIYNNRLQPCWMYSTTGSALPWNTTLCNGSTATGNIFDLKYSFNWGAGDNGNLVGITNNQDNTRSQTFSYDQLNRILTGKTTSTYATSPANCWGEQYGYDASGNWGNLLLIGSVSSAYNGCTQESGLSVAVTVQNQIVGNTYDTAGNLLTGLGLGSYTYNAENQMTSTAGTNYTYDGDGKRVQKSSGKIYWYGASGQVLDETDLTGSTTNGSFNEYVFFGGQRLARRDGSGNTLYYFADHLGTSRVIVQAGSTAPCYDADYYPFGGERPPLIATCSQNYKFTGKERDSESGLDNLEKRYYGSSLGRLMSPDPVFFQAEMLTDPQRLNEYAYARNNPLLYIDPTGEAILLSVVPEERQRQLDALCSAAGISSDNCGYYIYPNPVPDKNGNTDYYVGINTNGADGKGTSFQDLNDVAGALGAVINDQRVVQLDVVSAGETLTDNEGYQRTIGPVDVEKGTSPGATYQGQNGRWHIALLNPATAPGSVPLNKMSNFQPGFADQGLILAHEIGHLRQQWGLDSRHWMGVVENFLLNDDHAASKSEARRLENQARKLRDPNAPTRRRE